MRAELKRVIDAAWEERDTIGAATGGAVRDAVEAALTMLDQGKARFAEKGAEGGWTVKHGSTRARLEPGRGGGAFPGDNRLLAEWFANLASGSLVAIHSRFPIASVRVVNGRWDPR